MPLPTFAIALSQVHLPPRWAKHWGFARRIQDCNQCKLQKLSNPDSFRKELVLMRILLFQKMRGWLRQVPGNHTPPKVSDITTRIFTYTDAHLDLIPSTLDLMY